MAAHMQQEVLQGLESRTFWVEQMSSTSLCRPRVCLLLRHRSPQWWQLLLCLNLFLSQVWPLPPRQQVG